MCVPLLAALPGILMGALSGAGGAGAAAGAGAGVGAATSTGMSAMMSSLLAGMAPGAGVLAPTASTASALPGVVTATFAPAAAGSGVLAPAAGGLGTGFLGTGMSAQAALLGSTPAEIVGSLASYAGAAEQIWQHSEQKKQAKAAESAAKQQAGIETAALAQQAEQERTASSEQLLEIKLAEARARGTAAATNLPSESVAALQRDVVREAGRESSYARRTAANQASANVTSQRGVQAQLKNTMSAIRRPSGAGTALGVGSRLIGGYLNSTYRR